ncbi:uncharacterized protein [Ptychodera flava]|uniref:uncharacterized protein n=1 Tax=Ptychodera flava TaxID=63121 RepID=UPI00396A7A01
MMENRSESTEEINPREIAKRTSITECRLLTMAGIGIAISLSGIPFICSSGDETSFAVGLTLFCFGLLILMGMCCQGMFSSMRGNGASGDDDNEDDGESLTITDNTQLDVLHNTYLCVPTVAPDANDIDCDERECRTGIRSEDTQSLAEEQEIVPYHEGISRSGGDYILLTDIAEHTKDTPPTYDQVVCSDV